MPTAGSRSRPSATASPPPAAPGSRRTTSQPPAPGPSSTRSESAGRKLRRSPRAHVGRRGLVLAEARRPEQLGRLERRVVLDVEANPVALLDRGDRARVVAPPKGEDQRVAGADRRHLRDQERDRARDDREEQEPPEPVEEDGAGLDLGQEGSRPGRGEQLDDGIAGGPTPPDPET